MAFQKAVKRDAKGRVALIGPAGSGKSFTMLKLARLLAGLTGKIAAVDTEHGSLSKYADVFDFDVMELDSFSPQNFLGSLEDAEKAGYSVFCCDSLSHFWVGADGALEFVDNAQKRAQSRDGMSGWKDFRPWERRMVDMMISSPMHVIVTMRTKTAYEDQMVNGKKSRVKIGLAPVQRDGMEYEFDLVGAMDDENNLVVDKTRCSFYSGKVLPKPGEKEFAPFAEWLKGAKDSVPQATAGAPPVAAVGSEGGGSAPAPDLDVPEELRVVISNLDKAGGARTAFELMKKELLDAMPTSGGQEYHRILQQHGIKPTGGNVFVKVRAAVLDMWTVAQMARDYAKGVTESAADAPAEDKERQVA